MAVAWGLVVDGLLLLCSEVLLLYAMPGKSRISQ